MTHVSPRSIRRTVVKLGAVAALATLFGSATVPAHAAPEDASATGSFSLESIAPGARLTLTVTTSVPSDAVDGVPFVLSLPSFLTMPWFTNSTDCATITGNGSGFIAWTALPGDSGVCSMTLPLIATGSGTTAGHAVLSSPTAAAITQPPALTSTDIAAPVISNVMSLSAAVTAPAMGPEIGLQDFAYYRYELFDAAGTTLLDQNVTHYNGTTFSGSVLPGTTYRVKVTALDANGVPVVPLDWQSFPGFGPEVTSPFATFTSADPALLQAAVAELRDDINTGRLAREQMTESSWAGLVYALDDGWRDMALDRPQARYDEVLLAITTARFAIVDNTALRAAVQDAAKVDLSAQNYTPGTVTRFHQARISAENSLLTPLPQSAAEVAALTTALLTAVNDLAITPNDLTELRHRAFQLRFDTYSLHSIAALTAADAAVTDHLATESDPDFVWARTMLQDAIDGLVDVSSLHEAAAALRGAAFLELTAANAKTVDGHVAAVNAMLADTSPLTAADVAAVASAAAAAAAPSALVSLLPLSARLGLIDTYLVEAQFTPTSWQRLQMALIEPRAQLALWSTDVTATVTAQDIAEAGATVETWHRNLVHVGEGAVYVSKGGQLISAGETIAAGDILTIAARALEPGSSFRVELHSTPIELGRTTVAADGSAALTVTVPLDVSGAHTLHVYGVERGASTSTDTAFAVTVAAAPAAVVAAAISDALVATGGSLAGLTPALALLTLGAALLAFAKGRRRSIRTEQ